MIKLIIFDLDGVLVDACEIHRIALNKALIKNNNPSISLESHKTIFNGLPTKVKLKKLLYSDEEIEIINSDKQKITLEEIDNQIHKDHRLILLLSLLTQQCNYSLACVTNSITATTEKMLKNAGIIGFFSNIVSNEDVINPKPSSEGYIKAMVYAQAYPEETVIIEDSEVGYQGAFNTGARVIKVDCPSDVTYELFEKEGLLYE